MFIVDETSWDFKKIGAEGCLESLESLLDNLDEAIEAGCEACYSEDLFNIPVWADLSFYDLYSDTSPIKIPHEVKERVTALFGPMPKWQELELDWPASFDVIINDTATEEAPSIAWAHRYTIDNQTDAVSCLVLAGGRRSGQMDVKNNGETIPLWFIDALEQHKLFFRWIIVNKTKTHQELNSRISLAFPSIDFVEGCLSGIKDMSKKYTELVGDIATHLGVLSDYGNTIFEGDWQRATNEFGAHGITVTDENGKTKQNSKAKKARTIKINEQEVVFWWHCKIKPDRDRIHFCPKASDEGQILVGIFHRHLTT